jgi:hypothetical protein
MMATNIPIKERHFATMNVLLVNTIMDLSASLIAQYGMQLLMESLLKVILLEEYVLSATTIALLVTMTSLHVSHVKQE